MSRFSHSGQLYERQKLQFAPHFEQGKGRKREKRDETVGLGAATRVKRGNFPKSELIFKLSLSS